MQKRFLLLIVLCIFFLSITTFFLILNYLDPYVNKIIGIASIVTTFMLSISTFFTIFFYIIKKIYYRGRVDVYHVLTSFRQGFFISFFGLSLIFFSLLGVSLFLTGGVMFVLLCFIEMFIQNLEN